MSNFTFLNTDWPELYETAREAEQNVNSAPRTSFGFAQPTKPFTTVSESDTKFL